MKTTWLNTLCIALLLAPSIGSAEDASLQIGLEAAADYSAVYPSQSFGTSNRALNAVFRLASGEKHKSLNGVWIAVDVGGPEELLPIKVGQTWNYDFMQEGGSGAKITLPGITPDAQGSYHANVTLTVAGTDAAGAHVEMRRNNELVFHEWWRLDQKGLAATKRKAGDEESVLDPPQVLFAWPPKASKSWYYVPRDKSYHQTYKMWGPLPIKTAAGDKPGYVVFVEQRSKPVTITRAPFRAGGSGARKHRHGGQ